MKWGLTQTRNLSYTHPLRSIEAETATQMETVPLYSNRFKEQDMNKQKDPRSVTTSSVTTGMSIGKHQGCM